MTDFNRESRDSSLICKGYEPDWLEQVKPTVFTGYDTTGGIASCCAIKYNSILFSELYVETGCEYELIIDVSPFFSEHLWQDGDKGWIYGSEVRFEVLRVHTDEKGYTFHTAKCIKNGYLSSGDRLFTFIDTLRREEISRHHTSVHLLLAAVKEIFNLKTDDSGFYAGLNSGYIQFPLDFIANVEDIYLLERFVYSNILINHPVVTFMAFCDNKNEKKIDNSYSQRELVRICKIEDISREVCYGTHCIQTGDIGAFKIKYFSPNKLEFVAGMAAYRWIEEKFRLLLKGGVE